MRYNAKDDIAPETALYHLW